MTETHDWENIMTITITRRTAILGAAAIGGMALLPGLEARAQSGGLLERAKAAGSIKVAVPQTPPWSEIKPDGTLAGMAPEIYEPALKAIGIAKIEAIPATYAELIPGLAAGRWDICGASLTVSKARCEAVAFLSPTVFGYLSVAYRADEMKDPPLSMAEAGQRGLKISTNAGGYQLAALRKVAAAENILLFNDTASVLDSVASKRADIAIDAHYGMARLNKNPNITFTPPLTDMGFTASGIAIRKTDTDLYEALDAEIRKLKESGHVAKINEKYGNPYDPAKYNPVNGPMACESAAT